MRNALSILFTLIVLTGCGRDDIKVYRVPKEPTSGLPAGHSHPEPTAQPSLPQLRWQTPAGWTEGARSEFRVASFRVKGPGNKEADVSVVPIPGSAGGDLGNVNRWRDQVSQPPVTAAELAQIAQQIEVAGEPAALYDQAGAGPTGDPTRILAVIHHRAGTAWFFKMTGDSQHVAEQKPAFIEFLRTLQFGGSTPPPPTAGNPRWAPPADWTEVAGGQFLVAKFTIGGTQAAINVSSSVGDGGGLSANVNRWRRQLGLGELAGPELAKSVTMLPGGIAFVEMRGEREAVVGAVVTQPGQTWFYKLVGDPAVVAAQKDAFTKFVRGVQY
ncbi:MAG: hypothetical protein PCFJNLEI_01818 [Verrucomicrobiae bacterium]|nr:hypothetical protein [Verrucomicrobiae bacterium]